MTSIIRIWPKIRIEQIKIIADKAESVILSGGDSVELLPILWVTEFGEKSAVEGKVSLALRSLINERDAQIVKYIEELSFCVENVLQNCSSMLDQVRRNSLLNCSFCIFFTLFLFFIYLFRTSLFHSCSIDCMLKFINAY